MGLFRRSPRPSARPPELRPPRSMWWWTLPAALLIGAAAWGTAAWLLQDLYTVPVSGQVSARIEATRTALAAAAGVGAAVTLLLAVRRQRHQELTAAHTTHDAAERRVTELYGKAAEQLGNDQAPVRLAGLYALERLAQDTPTLRQTIVDVICAYLRMPFVPPPGQNPDQSADEPAVPRAAIAGVSAPAAGRDPLEERQVRLTAQRILTAHLRHDEPPPHHRWWQRRPPDPNPRHWPDITLDLTGAILIDLDLSYCRVDDALFEGATFTGEVSFEKATFNAARFDRATFTSKATFDGATFTFGPQFGGATFTGKASFGGATFALGTWFGGATYTGDAWFFRATFTRGARFDRATFTGEVSFEEATFNVGSRFDGVVFAGNALFSGATFIGHALFDGATGLETAVLEDVRVAPAAEGVRQRWPPPWRVEETADGWQTLRLAESKESGGAAGTGRKAGD
ncbi:pentapeptide repeat-containing protein [Nonomuraea sp. NPDC049625]|uniref:pentapeptide repeat-containing protein n=1 Tax=Nonomuraea sp. NPDC049625 TaxID=3155775 RepID=UPI003428B156